MGKLSEQCCQTTLVNVAINRQPGEAQGATMHKKKKNSWKYCSRKFPVYLQPKYATPQMKMERYGRKNNLDFKFCDFD